MVDFSPRPVFFPGNGTNRSIGSCHEKVTADNIMAEPLTAATSPSDLPAYLPTLTPLRGVAALMVVLLHADLFVAPLVDSRNSLLVKKWYLLVDFFFILSGFVISHVYACEFDRDPAGRLNANESHSISAAFKRFVVARFARLYPLQVLTTVWVFAAYGCLKWLQHPLPYEVEKFFAWPGFFTSLVFAQSLGLHDTWAGNGPSWSVSTEWWTYLVFPVLVARGAMRGRTSLVLACSFIGLSYLVIEYWLTTNCSLFADDRLTYMRGTLGTTFDFGLLRCAAGFVLGMLVYRGYLQRSAWHRWIGASLTFVGLTSLAALCMHCGANDVLTVALFALMIWSAAANSGRLKQICEQRWLQRLGDWSYAIYLGHFPVLCSMQVIRDAIQGPPTVAGSLPPITRPWLEAWTLALAWLVLTIGVAALLHHGFEVPARRWLRNKLVVPTPRH